jgi:putative AlgH/UPF0301 family transcriptional regulator
MFLRKLVFWAMLATIAALVAVRTLTVPTSHFAVAVSNSSLQALSLARVELLSHVEAAKKAAPLHPESGTKSEMTPAGSVPVQSRKTQDLGVGKLLVASRDLGDPIFAKAVVLLVRYDSDGVMGLMLNRRTDIPLSRVLEEYQGARGRSDQVYLGGPLQTPVLFALLQSAAKPDGAERIFDSIYLISKKALFEQIISTRPDPGVFHVYMGYVGWNPDQLRKEVQLGAWFIFQGDAKTVFNSDPDSLWPQMIQKTELEFAGVGL